MFGTGKTREEAIVGVVLAGTLAGMRAGDGKIHGMIRGVVVLGGTKEASLPRLERPRVAAGEEMTGMTTAGGRVTIGLDIMARATKQNSTTGPIQGKAIIISMIGTKEDGARIKTQGGEKIKTGTKDGEKIETGTKEDGARIKA